MVRRLSTTLVGPNSMFREGMKSALRPTQYQVKKVSETIDSVQEAVESDLILFIANDDQPILLDQVRLAKKDDPSTRRVVVIGDADDPDIVWPLLAAGADGYLSRTISFEALVGSLDVVMLGGTVVPRMQRRAFSVEHKHPGSIEHAAAVEILRPNAHLDCKSLSHREMDILLCLMKGESNKVIARKFNIAEATVKVHVKAILRKIRVSNRTQAAVWAQSNRLGQEQSDFVGADAPR